MFSTHIVGGEIIYDRINDSTYKITLKVYRDCSPGITAPFQGTGGNSDPAILTVYDANNNLIDTFDIGAPVISKVPSSINNPCITPPNDACVQQGIYTRTITLPPKSGGYYVIYQVALRNASIDNLTASGTQGSTYYTFVPGPETAAINSSPRYNKFPPIFICNNVSFTFDHSATDPDGDQLVYSLCAPYQGLSQACPSFFTPGCPPQADPPPYTPVNYAAPYNGTYPIPSNPAFSINPTTGVLTGRPNMLGQYVVSICVQEFRNNMLINTHYRDFQFNVRPCIVSVVSSVADQKTKCQGNVITFTNSSTSNIGSLTYLWDFGVPNILSDTSKLVNPSYTYQDTGTYEVTLIANPNKACSDTFKKTVYVYPKLDVNFGPTNRQCFKGNSFSFSPQGSYLANSTFTWNFTSAATPSTSTIKNPTAVVYNQPGKYFVKLRARQPGGCIDSFIDSIRVLRRPVAKINNLPVTLCDPARVAFSNGSTSDLPLTYQWLFSNGKTSQAYEPLQVFSPAGVYSATLIVKTATVCVDTSVASVSNITVNPAPIAGFTLSPQITTIFDPEITIRDSSSNDVLAWQYSFGDGGGTANANEIHTYQEYGDYVVTQIVTNNFNCTDTLSQLVKILPEFRFWIPNTFTPDGNSLNEIFMPTVIGVSDYDFTVYDKWGEEVYHTQTIGEGWDGNKKDKKCTEDVYVWRVAFKNIVSLRFEYHYGQVTLLHVK